MTVITLTTDLGISSAAVGQLNGMIWRIAPDAQIVDLTHAIPTFDIYSGQVVLEIAIPYFPDGTIHLAATSPSSEETNRVILARMGPMLFVGPDNGLITPLLVRAEANRWPIEIYHANKPEYQHAEANLPGGSAPASVCALLAAYAAKGILLSELGERISDPVRASIPAPEMIDEGWRGQVVQIDHFGNLAVNIKRVHLEGMGPLQVQIGGLVIEGLANTFGDAQPGELIALLDSSNRLSICVVNGSAAAQINTHMGDPVEVHPKRR